MKTFPTRPLYTIMRVLIVVCLPVLALFIGQLVVDVSGEPAQARGTVTGRLISPEGLPLPNGTIVGLARASVRSGEGAPRIEVFPTDYEGILDLATGQFAIEDVPLGNYVLTVVPTDSSSLILNQAPFVSLLQETVTLGEIDLIEPQIEGRVFNPDGVQLARNSVVLTRVGEEAASAIFRTFNGRFFFHNLPAGDYILQADPSGIYDNINPSEPITITLIEGGPQLSVSVTVRGPDLFGTVVGPDGAPLSGQRIKVESNRIFRNDYTNFAGEWVFGTLPPDIYTLTASYRGQGISRLIEPDPITVEIPATNLPITITYSKWPANYKTVSGTVSNNYGEPITNAIIYANQLYTGQFTRTVTDEKGNYFFDLYPALWEIGPIHNGTDGILLEDSAVVSFPNDGISETHLIDFDFVLIDSEIKGVLMGEDGARYTDSVNITFRNQDLQYTGYIAHYDRQFDEGAFTVSVPPGRYEIEISTWDIFYTDILLQDVVVDKGSEFDLGEILIREVAGTVRGAIFTNDGGDTSERIVTATEAGSIYSYNATRFEAVTDASGAYTFTLPAGLWDVSIDRYQGYYRENSPIRVLVKDDDELSGINFDLVAKNGTLTGQLLENGVPISTTLTGNAVAAFTLDHPDENRFDSPYPSPGDFFDNDTAADGEYDLQLPPGRFILDFLFKENNWFTTEPTIIEVGENTTETIEINLEPADAVLQGSLVDARTGEGVSSPFYTDIDYQVVARKGHHERIYRSLYMNQYEFNLLPGEWYIEWPLICHDSISCIKNRYIAPSSGLKVTLASSSTTDLDLPVYLRDGLMTGTVSNPVNSSTPNSVLVATGLGELADLKISERIYDDDYQIRLPHGDWSVYVHTLGDDGLYHSPPITVTIPQTGTLSGIDFAYQPPNGVLSGRVTALGVTTPQSVTLVAVTEGAGSSSVVVPMRLDGINSVGTFTVPIQTGEIWVQGTRSNGIERWIGEARLASDGDASIDLTLIPENFMGENHSDLFWGDQPFSLTRSDQASVSVPAGLLTEGEVYKIKLSAGFPYLEESDLRMLNYGYDLTLTPMYSAMYSAMYFEDGINMPLSQPLEYRLPYPLYAPWGLDNPALIQVIAYSEVTQAWEIITETSVNTADRTISFSSAEHSRFALVGSVLDQVDGVNTLLPFKAYFPTFND